MASQIVTCPAILVPQATRLVKVIAALVGEKDGTVEIDLVVLNAVGIAHKAQVEGLTETASTAKPVLVAPEVVGT